MLPNWVGRRMGSDVVGDLMLSFHGNPPGENAPRAALLGRTRANEDSVGSFSSLHQSGNAARKMDAADPGLEDLAPTALTLFGLQPPAWMEGKSVFDA
jgi:hypothetical protein